MQCIPVGSLLDSFGHRIAAAAVITGRGFFKITVWGFSAGLVVGLEAGPEAGEARVRGVAGDAAIPVLVCDLLARKKSLRMWLLSGVRGNVVYRHHRDCRDRSHDDNHYWFFVLDWVGGLEDSSQNYNVNDVWKELVAQKIWFLSRGIWAHFTFLLITSPLAAECPVPVIMCALLTTYPLHGCRIVLGWHRWYRPHRGRDLGHLEVIPVLRMTSRWPPGPAVTARGREAAHNLRLRLLGLRLRVWRLIAHPGDIDWALAELKNMIVKIMFLEKVVLNQKERMR